MDKRVIGHVVFYVMLGVFALVYFFGQRGVGTLCALKRANRQLVLANEALKAENKQLMYMIDYWRTDPFCKERFAREKLQLAYPGDHVYYLS